jgi:hypothetical protein
LEGVGDGELKPNYPLNDIFAYIATSIDGVIKSVVFQKCYGTAQGNIDAVNIIKMISDSTLYFLSGK